MSDSFAAHWAARQFRCPIFILVFSARSRLPPEFVQSDSALVRSIPSTASMTSSSGVSSSRMWVSLLTGAAGLISPAGVAAGLLTAASGILAVEAYHAGYIRTSLNQGQSLLVRATNFSSAGQQGGSPYASLTVGASAAPSTAGSVETLLVLPTTTATPSAPSRRTQLLLSALHAP